MPSQSREGIEGDEEIKQRHAKLSSNADALHGDTKHFFGLKQGNAFPHGIVQLDDYEKKYPEDPIYEETAQNARVWRTYLEECAVVDGNMVGESRDGLDAMLVFAGLFSSVVSSFLAQTSQNLEPDFTQVSASLLFELVAVQRAAAGGVSANGVPSSPLDPTSKFMPSLLDTWINALWVVSLTLSLLVALAAVLVKQWLHRYMTLRSGTPGERSHIRQYRYNGFVKWHVLLVIGILPVIMHLSLGFFFVGFTLFLFPLSLPLACLVGALTAVVYTLYSVTAILPIFFPECPYKTPLTDFVFPYCRRVGAWIKALRFRRRQDVSDDLTHPTSLKEMETHAVLRIYDELSVKALHWLYHVSSNPTVQSLVIQAIGGLPTGVARAVNEIFDSVDIQQVHERLVLSSTTPGLDSTTPWSRKVADNMESTVERLGRTSVLLWQHDLDSHWVSFNCSDDPRIRATSLGLSPWGLSERADRDTYRTFILMHHNVRCHPLIWVNLVHNAYLRGAFDFEDGDALNGDLCKALVRGICQWGSEAPGSAHPSSTMTIAIQCCMDRELWKQLMIAVMEFALRCVTQPSVLPVLTLQGAHWDILHSVLYQFANGFEDMYKEPDIVELAASYVQRIALSYPLRVESNYDHHAPSAQRLSQLRTNIVVVHKRLSRNLGHAPAVFGPKMFAALVPIIRASANGLFSLHESAVLRNMSLAVEILSIALESGNADAYEMTMEDKYLELALRLHTCNPALSNHTALITAYVSGLPMIARSEQDRYVKHLHTPRTLCMGILELICSQTDFELEPDIESSLWNGLKLLSQVNPLHPSWTICRHDLERISTWAQNTTAPLQLDWGEDHLHDLLRKLFSRQDMKDRLNTALKMLNKSLSDTNIAESGKPHKWFRLPWPPSNRRSPKTPYMADVMVQVHPCRASAFTRRYIQL